MTDDDIARLRGLAQAAKEAEAAYRALPSDAGADDVMRLGRARNSTLLVYENATEPDVLLRLLDERDALRRQRDEAQRDARELRFLWEQRGERANKAEDERDAAMALLRECDEVAGSLCGVADLVKHGGLFARIDELLNGDKGA